MKAAGAGGNVPPALASARALVARFAVDEADAVVAMFWLMPSAPTTLPATADGTDSWCVARRTTWPFTLYIPQRGAERLLHLGGGARGGDGDPVRGHGAHLESLAGQPAAGAADLGSSRREPGLPLRRGQVMPVAGTARRADRRDQRLGRRRVPQLQHHLEVHRGGLRDGARGMLPGTRRDHGPVQRLPAAGRRGRRGGSRDSAHRCCAQKAGLHRRPAQKSCVAYPPFRPPFEDDARTLTSTICPGSGPSSRKIGRR